MKARQAKKILNKLWYDIYTPSWRWGTIQIERVKNVVDWD